MDNNPLIIDISSISSDEENQLNNIEDYNKKNNKSEESEDTYITIFGGSNSISPDGRNRTENEKTCLGKAFEYCINSKILTVICNPVHWIGTSVFIGIVLIAWVIIDAALK